MTAEFIAAVNELRHYIANVLLHRDVKHSTNRYVSAPCDRALTADTIRWREEKWNVNSRLKKEQVGTKYLLQKDSLTTLHVLTCFSVHGRAHGRSRHCRGCSEVLPATGSTY